MGKKPVDLAEIFTARNSYHDKAKLYVLNNGAISWGDGGELHDVINMYKKYGAVPQDVYTGLKAGQTTNNFKEMQGKLKPVLDSLVQASSKGKLTDNWMDSVDAILDEYLGKVPANFTYEGKNYTPKTFAKEVVGINPEDYVELSSYKDYPYYQKFVVPIPDNWSHDSDWNVPMKDLTSIIDNAVTKGYSVGWATDVSEPYFSYKNGWLMFRIWTWTRSMQRISRPCSQNLKKIKPLLKICVRKALTIFLQRMTTVCTS